ncbi:MAG: AbrB/MazE/SpoVT family DNA-binding domain-containing protein [Thermoplasmatota archaeon]
MSDVEVEVKKWGNSLGVVIPADVGTAEGLAPGDRVWIRITKLRHPLPGSFGRLRGWKIDAQKMKDELRRDHAR